MAHEFWKSAGLHLTEPSAEGWAAITPQLLRAYWTRPEVHPVEESNDFEIGLHEALLVDPMRSVSEADLAALEDPDAIETYRIILAFRDVLMSAGTVEGAYLKLVRGHKTTAPIPPVFLDQMVHLILRNALKDCGDPLRLRAAEIFFREQTVSTPDGRLMLADEEIVEMQSKSQNIGLAQLLAETATPAKSIALDVLDEENKALYWGRSDRFDTVIDFRFEQPALDAFARVVEVWLKHMIGVSVRVEPRPKVEDRDWRWHIGLDAQATKLLNALYEGRDVSLDQMSQIVGLFRMRFDDESRLIERVRGKPVYLALAKDAEDCVRMKPQNLLVNLPFVASS
ncbi:MAG: DUF6352 family protein [Hyphomicrobiaceae bacterium]